MIHMMRVWVAVLLGACAQVGAAPVLVWSNSGPARSAFVATPTTRAAVGAAILGTQPDLALVVFAPSANWATTKPALAARLDARTAVDSYAFVEHEEDRCFFEDMTHVPAADIDEALAAWTPRHNTTVITTALSGDWSILDARLAALDEALAARAKSYVVAVVGAPRASVARRLDAAPAAEENDWASKYDGIRNTPDILTGVLVGLLFAFVVIVGMTCLNSIQTPSKYSKVGPPSLKEW